MEKWEIYKAPGGFRIVWGVLRGQPILFREDECYKTIADACAAFQKIAEMRAKTYSSLTRQPDGYLVEYRNYYGDQSWQSMHFEKYGSAKSFQSKARKAFADDMVKHFKSVNAEILHCADMIETQCV